MCLKVPAAPVSAMDLEELVEESIEPASPPGDLIREDHVSKEEVDAFQKRLSTDSEASGLKAAVAEISSADQIESQVRTGVEEVLKNISDSVIPELTRAIVRVASDRIEEVVQRIVPELAEGAISKELERLKSKGEI